MLTGKNILLVISGGIAAYKSLELIRLIRKNGGDVRCILTSGGAQFVTPLSVASLSENPVYTDLWSLKDETEMGHIRLSRECDVVMVAPASANLMAKLAHGMADDLATTTLLASDKPVILAPAMNPQMWENAATQANLKTLSARGFKILSPGTGEMACGEIGQGRLPEAQDLLDALTHHFSAGKPLAGKRAVVTAGPTYEPIDPVRFVGNRSSGKQGYAIAAALEDLGASVTLISGPSDLKSPQKIKTIRIENAAQMLENCQKSLPADIVVCAAAVADWTPEIYQPAKMKKATDDTMSLPLRQTTDILKTLSAKSPLRPALVVGFAAETENLIENAKAKLAKKGCDWVVANLISEDNPAFGADKNQVYLVTSDTVEPWPKATKESIARTLALRIAEAFSVQEMKTAAE
jgi:phosphopantothenoylcysteine decarboxylase/phosphopantothenate--cysteine ligase